MKTKSYKLPKMLVGLVVVGLYLLFAPSAYAITETFTSSGTWTCPAGVTSVTVEVWGAGGGGGGDNTKSSNTGGSGGGGGAYAKLNTYAVTPGNNYSYTVGLAGAAGAIGGPGGTGGDSFFVSNVTVMAKGGIGGSNDAGAAGSGGLAASSVGDVKYSGGNGFVSNTASGGGGGGSAGTASAGSGAGSATGAAAVAGGGPGGNGGAANSAGSAPVSGPGGGGGGAGDRTGSGMLGGAGFAGQVRLTYTVVAVAPTLTTPTATSIASTTATLGANITSDGGSALTARGTVWGTTAAPTGNQVAQGGTTTGVFTQARTGLTAQTKIYYRGYATNSAGTAYSPDGSFYTEPATQASGVSFTSVTSTGMTVNWTRGSGGAGGGVLVVMKAGSAVDATPADGTYTGYSANSAFGGGTAITAGNFVVYKGTGTSVVVTGLSPTTSYNVAVFEFAGQIDTAGVDLGTNYKLTPATGIQATPSAPVDTLSVTTNTPVAAAAAPLATNVQMQSLQVDSNIADNGNVVISSITVDDLGTAGALDITNLKIHIDNDNNFGNGVLETVTQAGFNGSSTVVSLVAMTAGTRTVTNGTSKYIWITYDLAASADGKTIQSSVTAIAVVGPDNGASGTWNSNIISVSSGPISTLANCGSCHNYPPVDSATRNATTGNFVGDHDKHSTNTCATCHVTPATETATDFAHRTGKLSIDNGNIGAGADNGTYSKGTEFNQVNNPTGGTCSAVDCHSNAVTPQWGVGTTACNSCHALPPNTNAHTAHYTAKGWAADNANCTVCHPDNTSGHSDVTDSSVTVIAGLSPSGTSPAITCSATPAGCHNGKTTPAWNTTNIVCTNCHTAGGAAAGDPTSGLHATTSLTDHDGTLTGGTGNPCEKCHTASPSNLHFNGTVNNAANATFAWATNITTGYDRTNDYCAATCHSDGGTWNREWSGVTDAAWAYGDNASSAAVCGNCHGSFFTGWNIIGNTSHDNPDVDNDPNTLATAKASHTECSTCHAWGHTNYTTGTKHKNNLLEMNSTLDSTPGDGSCTTTCHAAMTLTMNATSGWTDASVAGAGVVCGGCHTGGVTTATASGVHAQHGATAASVAANPASIALCIECHGNDGTGVTHNNGSVNFANVTYSTAVRNNLTGTCLTANCHNFNGKTEQSNAWNATQLECDDCHYYSATPTSAGNTAHGRPLSASHADHFSAGKTCAQCHGTMPIAGDTSHITGVTSNADKAVATQDEAAVSFTGSTTYTFEDTGNTCYSATNSGLGCHATAGAAGAGDATRPDWDVAFDGTNGLTGCIACHTNTSTAGVNPTSGLHGVVPSVSGKQHNQTIDGTNGCKGCHTTIPQFTTHKGGTFEGGSGQTSAMGLAAFYSQTADDTGTCATTTCHLGNSDAWAHKWMATANYTNATNSCTGCHGNLTSGWNAGVDHLVGGIASDHADSGTANNYGCENCHALQASTNNYPFTFGTADWAPLNAGNKHGNNLITMNDDGTGTISNWQRGTAGNSAKSMCLKCHTDWVDSAPQHWFVNTSWTPEEIVGDGISAGHSVGANCKGCHATANGAKRAIQTDFNATYNHGPDSTSAWTTMTNADCEACHDETTGPDGNLNLKVVGGASISVPWVAGFGYTQAALVTINQHCLSCHDGAGTSIMGVAPTTRANISTLWSNATYNSHSETGNVVPVKVKARSAHAAPATNILKDETARTGYTTAVACLECHPSHGSSVKSPDSAKGNLAIVGNMMKTGYTEPGTCWSCHDAAGVKDYMGDSTTPGTHWSGNKKSEFAYKQRAFLSTHEVNGAGSGIVCSVCHNPHGSTTGAQYNTPMLRGTWMTSPYPEDRTGKMNGSELAGAYATKSTADNGPRHISTALYNKPAQWGHGYGAAGGTGHDGYYIDDNTFGSNNTTYAATPVAVNHITPADSSVFGGLCASCHTSATFTGGTVADMKLYLDTTTFATGWGASVHNAVKGWSDGTTDCLNATNSPKMHLLTSTKTNGIRFIRDTGYFSPRSSYDWGSHQNAGTQAGYHAFPCSKCHTPHANSQPRLMVSNCLDVGTSTTSRKAHGTEPAFTQTTYSVFTGGGNLNVQETAMHCHNRGKLNTTTGGGWNKVTGW